jgi:DNA-binding response OmpR family regulator
MAEARRPRVLVIDDDPSVLEVVRYLLAAFGLDCQTAVNGASGLARFDEGGWDLVLTDLAMPAMSGWDVIEAIRERAPTMPIILITAFSDADVMRRASEWRVPVVTKPFPMATLKAAVVEALYRKPSE